MMEEQLKTKESAATAGEPILQAEGVKKPRKGRKRVQEFLGGDYLSREWVVGNLPYLLFLTILAILYIGTPIMQKRHLRRSNIQKPN